MFKIYEHTIPGTNIHLIVAFIILIEILIAFYQSILYLSRPIDKSRLRYLILTILFIQYNISGGLVVDERLTISILLQGAIGILSSLLMSAYLPYYIYKNLNLRALRFFAYYGSFLFILLPYLFAFLIPLIIYKDYMFASRLYIVVPILYAFPFIYYLTKAIVDENRKKELTNRHKEQLYGTYLATLFWILMPVVFFFNGDQISEHIVANTGYLIMSVIFIRASIMDSRDEYNKLIISEKELLKVNKTLEQKVLQRTSDLEQANKYRTDTVISLAHETRTPITLIKNNIDDYTAKYGGTKELDKVKTNIDKINELMGNILNIDRFEKGQTIYSHNKVINISSFATIKINNFEPYAKKKNLKLISNIPNDIYLKISPNALDSLLDNLIANAIKFTEQGSISVSLSKKEKTILSVKDTGVGIPVNVQDKIFEPYFHFSKNDTPGFGIGLSIVKNIVKSINGAISFTSNEGTGTEFIVEFDNYQLLSTDKVFDDYKVMPSHFEVTEVIKDETIHQDKPSVLIIEDNPDLLIYLKEKLKQSYNIYVAPDGNIALKKIKEIPTKPDLIISDVMMGSLDGLGFYEQLKRTDYHYIPLIYITAKANSIDRDKALAMGAIDYIYKPFDISEVKNKIASIIKHSKEQRSMTINNMKKILDLEADKLLDLPMNNLDNFDSVCEQYKISNREREVIKLAREGKTYNEIADELNISKKTVDTHFQNIFKKIGVNKLQELLNKLFN